jgi:hypothetical protein
MEIEGYWLPARLTKIVKLPLFDTVNVSHTAHAVDSKGRLPPLSSVWLKRAPTTFRREGASYLLSSAYSPDNGLAQFVLSEDEEGRPPPPLGFVDGGNRNLANMRWITPHNPMPCPVEGYSTSETTLRMYSVGIKFDPTPTELMDGMVESRLSAFFIKKDPPEGPGLSHRDVPVHIRRKLRTNSENFESIKSLGVISLRGSIVPARSSTLPTASDETGAKNTATKTEGPTLPEPPAASLAVQPSDSGVKPVMPSVKTPGKQDDQSGDGD